MKRKIRSQKSEVEKLIIIH